MVSTSPILTTTATQTSFRSIDADALSAQKRMSGFQTYGTADELRREGFVSTTT